MGSFTVLFYGICTNFRHVPGNPHIDRMVLVNGDLANIAYLETHLGISPPPKIEPHKAWLWIDGEKDPRRIEGVVITVENVVPGLSFDMNCLPNLTGMNAKIGKVLGPIAPAYVLDEEKTKSSCYFDFTGGTIGGCASKSGDDAAAMTKVVVTTTTATPRLLLREFKSTNTTPVDVPDGGKVWVMNVPKDARDDHEVDFYLHYLTAKTIPNKPATVNAVNCATVCGPPPKLPKKLHSHLYLMAGAGCSNSNFP